MSYIFALSSLCQQQHASWTIFDHLISEYPPQEVTRLSSNTNTFFRNSDCCYGRNSHLLNWKENLDSRVWGEGLLIATTINCKPNGESIHFLLISRPVWIYYIKANNGRYQCVYYWVELKARIICVGDDWCHSTQAKQRNR